MTLPRLRRLRWWDLPEVAQLDRQLFPDGPWSVEQWWSELAGVPASRHYLVVEVDDRPLAYAGLLLGLDVAEVLTLAVAPNWQRRGLGRRLLRELLAEAYRRGAPEVQLEVRADEPAAIALYLSEGFGRVGVRRGYYAGGTVDALVLRRRNRAS